MNDWALTFWPKFDIQLESKAKNLARDKFYAHATQQRELVDFQISQETIVDLQAA